MQRLGRSQDFRNSAGQRAQFAMTRGPMAARPQRESQSEALEERSGSWVHRLTYALRDLGTFVCLQQEPTKIAEPHCCQARKAAPAAASARPFLPRQSGTAPRQ